MDSVAETERTLYVHTLSLSFPLSSLMRFCFECVVFAASNLILVLNVYFVALNFVLILIRYPYVTGSSVVAIKYKDGILMAADMGGPMLNLVN